jgi:hypothetical protein
MDTLLRYITKDSEEIPALERINEEAIPENERNTLIDMLSTGAEIFGIFSEQKPVGFIMYRKYKNICYLAYLAVECSLRSNGIGSEALKLFLAEHNDYKVVVEYEAPDTDCDKADINYRRKQFYLRNGFSETGWFTYYDEIEFEIGCAGSKFDINEFNGFIGYLSTIISDHIPEPYRK